MIAPPAGHGPHVARFFDTETSRTGAVLAYVVDALQSGDCVLVVSTAGHWQAIAQRLAARGGAAAGAGRLSVLDAETLLDQLLVDGEIDAVRFDQTVGSLVRQMTAGGVRLRVYGEMVDLLAEAGSFAAAERLEWLWNRLAASVAFTLLCGYSAVHFGHPRTAAALRRICDCHTRVHAEPDDELAAWLLGIPRPAHS